MKHTYLAFFFIFSNSGCTSGTKSSDLKMTNPESLDVEKFPWAGHLVVASRGIIPGWECTASLLKANIAITARHCVNFAGERDRKPEEVTFKLPGRGESKVTGWKSLGRDLHEELTILHLVKSFDLPEFPEIATEELKLNDIVGAIGFGMTTYSKTADKKLDVGQGQYGKMKFTGYDELEYPLPGLAGVDVVHRRRNLEMANFQQVHEDGNMVCPGDSGGPAFVETSDGIRLFGVASHLKPEPGKDLGVCDPRSTAVHVALHRHREWIEKTIREMENLK